MRALAVVILLLCAPLASALLAPAPNLVSGAAKVRDADVLVLLAREWGVEPTRLPIPVPAAGDSVALATMRLAERSGATLEARDASAYDTLHPLLAAPTLTLLVAVEQAWVMRDAAFADWSQEDIDLALAAIRAGEAPPKVLSNDQKEQLINAAIMLSDTIESIVIPQLQAAANVGVWPATPIADPVGVLRIGGTGNDLDTLDRIVSLDARGNDEYRNNIGGGYTRSEGNVQRTKPIGIGIDLSGDDTYHQAGARPAWGGAEFGIGLLYELGGNDFFIAGSYFTSGAGGFAVGVFRDVAGNDRHHSDFYGLGYGAAGIGYHRNDAGDDEYRAVVDAGGGSGLNAVGAFWDESGTDWYDSVLGDTALWGYSFGNGKAWFVDETASIDKWTNAIRGVPHPRACNDCLWIQGSDADPPGGRGNDNRGGLAYLLAWQDP